MNTLLLPLSIFWVKSLKGCVQIYVFRLRGRDGKTLSISPVLGGIPWSGSLHLPPGLEPEASSTGKF